MKKIFTLFFIFIGSFLVKSQEKIDTSLVFIKLKDGSQLYGRIQAKENEQIILLNKSLGIISIDRDNVISISKSNGPSIIDYRKELIYNQDYILTENAYTPKRNSFYFTNIDLFYNKLGYAINDHVAVEIGGLLIPDVSTTLFTANVKGGYPLHKYMNLAIKAQYFKNIQEDNSVTTLSSIATFGTLYNNLSFSFNRAITNDMYSDPEKEYYNFFTVGSTVAINKKIGIKAEYIRFDKNTKLLNIGLNFNWSKLSLSVGVLNVRNDEDDYEVGFIPVPIIGLKIPF